MKKRLIMVLGAEEFSSYKKDQLMNDALIRAALKIGYLAITNPDQSFQWIGNVLVLDNKSKKVYVYAKFEEFKADPKDYLIGG